MPSVLADWHFNTAGDTENWSIGRDISSMTVSDGELVLTLSGDDSQALSPNNLGFDLSQCRQVRVSMLNQSSSGSSQMFFETTTEAGFSESKSVTVTTVPNDTEYREYVYDFSDNPSWTGTLKRLRFDPANLTGTTRIDYIQLVIPKTLETLVGINYFGGWWYGGDGIGEDTLQERAIGGEKWVSADPVYGGYYDWRTRFPERIPLLGQYACNEQETVDREICAAAGNGVDFFKILYYNTTHRDCEANDHELNKPLEFFRLSPEKHRMKYCIEFCNAECYSARTRGELEDLLLIWEPYFADPSYLRLDGKLVFQIHGWHWFWGNCGTYKEAATTLGEAQWRINRIREFCRDKGYGEMLIGIGAGGRISTSNAIYQCGFDWFSSYGSDGRPVYNYPQIYQTYSDLADYIYGQRLDTLNSAIPFMPMVSVGWNPEPWNYHYNSRASFNLPTYQEWIDQLALAKWDTESQSSYGLPGQNAIIIYAWNEYGEGGFISPTQGWGFARLDGIRQVFGAPDAFAGYYVIQNKDNNNCLRAAGGSTDQNALIVQEPYDDTDADRDSWWWNVVKLSGDDYRLINVKSGLGLTVSGDNLVQQTYLQTDDFAWTISEVSQNFQTLGNVASGLCMVPQNESAQGGAVIAQKPCQQTASYQWNLLRPESFGRSICKGRIEDDLNNDCIINLGDYAILADAWLGSDTNGWYFPDPAEFEGWTILRDISDMTSNYGKLVLTLSGNDSNIISKVNLGIDISQCSQVRISMRNQTSSPTSQVFFTTTTEPGFDASKSVIVTTVPNDTEHREYVYDFSGHPSWTGTLDRLRFDPSTSTGTASIDYIKLICNNCVLSVNADLSGPDGVPDCEVDLYDLEAIALQWLANNFDTVLP